MIISLRTLPSFPSSPLTTPSLNCTSSSKSPSHVLTRPRGDTPKELENDLLDSFKINVVGNIHLFNLYLPLILKGSAKKVVALSTGMSDTDFVAKYDVVVAAPYSISKAAMNLAVAKYSAEYAKDGVLFLSISPGYVDTGNSSNREYSSPRQLYLTNTIQLPRDSWRGFRAWRPALPSMPHTSLEPLLQKNLLSRSCLLSTMSLLSRNTEAR